MRTARQTLVLLMISTLCGSASWAGDEALFEGLIPGQPLAEQELDHIYGKGVELVFDFGGDGVVNVDGIVDLNDSSTSNQTIDTSSTNGVTAVVPVIGDENAVTINVMVTVNINTVTITDAAGSEIGPITQSFDFGGGVLQVFGP